MFHEKRQVIWTALKGLSARHWVVSVSLFVVSLRAAFPNLRIDEVSLWLLILAAIAALVPDIGGIVERVKKVKKGDFELEFEGRLEDLKRKTEETEQVLEAKDLEFGDIPGELRSRITRSLVEPRAALITVAIEIEGRLREIADTYEISHRGRFFSPRRTIENLAEAGQVEEHIPALFADFWATRNQAIHSRKFVPDQDQLYSLVDLGMRILSILYGSPLLQSTTRTEE